MNKTFLILILIGISYTAYNAAAVSENFAISTTIDHEVTLGSFRAASADAGLDVTGNINLGTIIVNTDYSEGSVSYNESGIVTNLSGAIVSADNATLGYFTANVPNPEECNDESVIAGDMCAGLRITGTDHGWIDDLLGGNISDYNGCIFHFRYVGNNKFKVFPLVCIINTIKTLSFTTNTGTLTIEYTPS